MKTHISKKIGFNPLFWEEVRTVSTFSAKMDWVLQKKRAIPPATSSTASVPWIHSLPQPCNTANVGGLYTKQNCPCANLLPIPCVHTFRHKQPLILRTISRYRGVLFRRTWPGDVRAGCGLSTCLPAKRKPYFRHQVNHNTARNKIEASGKKGGQKGPRNQKLQRCKQKEKPFASFFEGLRQKPTARSR